MSPLSNSSLCGFYINTVLCDIAPQNNEQGGALRVLSEDYNPFHLPEVHAYRKVQHDCTTPAVFRKVVSLY